jgi:hypothetical protein
MKLLLLKTTVVALLTIGAMLQGWPLLVATMCSMPEPQTMTRMAACCCCEKPESSTGIAFASCSPGKTLAGILVTDPSLQPVKEKTKPDSLPLSPSAAIVMLDVARVFNTAVLSFCFDQTPFGHTASPPLFLLDSEFRI